MIFPHCLSYLSYLWHKTLWVWNTILKFLIFPDPDLVVFFLRLWLTVLFCLFIFNFQSSTQVLNVGIHQRSILVTLLSFSYWNFHSCSGCQLLNWCGLQNYFSLSSLPVCWTSLHVSLANLKLHWICNSSLYPNTHLGKNVDSLCYHSLSSLMT